jgi:hypothetical protein
MQKSKVFTQKSNMPNATELPSTSQLVKSTILAAAAAGVLLVTVVMPAEYGIDPTGIGNLIGLKRMGEIRVSLEKEAKEDQARDQASNSSTEGSEASQSDVNPAIASTPQSIETQPTQSSGTSAPSLSHEMQVALAPDEGAEIKVAMGKGNKVQYAWSTDGGKANFDIHADSQTLGIDYHQYSKGSSQSEQGEIEAAFDGSHGWFWRNRTSEPIVITLKTEGQYTEISRKK